DAEEVLSAATDNTKAIFICSPNNPTGNLLSRKSILKILDNFNGLVVLDEAYVDFAETKSFIEEINKRNNLIVLQTFSKAWGLANLRVGSAFADKRIISILNKIKYPYNVNGLSQKAVLQALSKTEEVKGTVRKIIAERTRLKKGLQNFDFVKNVFPSDANFLLVKVAGASKIYDYLLKNGVIVRNRSGLPHCEECLRFTVGAESENDKLLELLSNYGA
ncbi:MAG: aminotransferase class I/II-fold pyridoxal phosphate-dependent enzyme, partial [Chlorobi bacterium]|nr:aminotransferase class I/II-fold pyridoxal phosphate-dependent enzyme [Chlorobiota bacterium]